MLERVIRVEMGGDEESYFGCVGALKSANAAREGAELVKGEGLGLVRKSAAELDGGSEEVDQLEYRAIWTIANR